MNLIQKEFVLDKSQITMSGNLLCRTIDFLQGSLTYNIQYQRINLCLS
jgi:hypothetical protein